MSRDLIERLRDYTLDWRDRAASKDVVDEAMAEISRLRAELSSLRGEGEEAAEQRDALLAALGWKTGPFASELSRKVILEDSAGLRPEMVKARERAHDAEADRDLWRWIAGDVVNDSRSGLLIRIWNRFKEERKSRRALETLLAAPAAHPTPDSDVIGRLVEALEKIAHWAPRPFEMPANWSEQIEACADCQRYSGHPIQRGICDTHRRPLWDREKHDKHQDVMRGLDAQQIAAAALASIPTPDDKP